MTALTVITVSPPGVLAGDPLQVASCPLGKWEAEIKQADIDAIKTFLQTENQFRTNGQLAKLYSKVTGTNTQASQCSSCNRRMLAELQKLIDETE